MMRNELKSKQNKTWAISLVERLNGSIKLSAQETINKHGRKKIKKTPDGRTII